MQNDLVIGGGGGGGCCVKTLIKHFSLTSISAFFNLPEIEYLEHDIGWLTMAGFSFFVNTGTMDILV